MVGDWGTTQLITTTCKRIVCCVNVLLEQMARKMRNLDF